MKYCQKCGAVNEEAAVFCNKCATKFVQFETPQPNPLNQQHTQQSHELSPKKKKWSRKKKIIVGCIVAFFLIIGIFSEDPTQAPDQTNATETTETSEVEPSESTTITTTKAIDENIQTLIDATGYGESVCENIYNQLTECGYTSIGKLTFVSEGTTTKSFKVTGEYYGSGMIIVEESGLYYFSWGSDTLYDAENPDVIKNINDYAIGSSDNIRYFSSAEDAIKKLLKSPSTAEFPSRVWSDGWGISISDGIVTVSSYVDAQNSFGAMLRSYFTVQYRISDGHGIYLEFDDQIYIDER